MKKFLATALLAVSLSAMGSDGYVGWSELTFQSGPWNVHATLSDDNASFQKLEISRSDSSIDLPQDAIPTWGQPLLNGVKLLSICCNDHVALQIPMLKFDHGASSTQRTWEIHVSGGRFDHAGWAQPSDLPK